jgi:glycosyltransferase involved in cell wall biosynthesis
MPNILFLLEDYNYFYTNGSQKLNAKSYKETLETLISKKHYQSDSMAKAFDKLGYNYNIVIPECNPLQLKWAKEHSKLIYFKWLIEKPIRSFKSRILKQYRSSFNSIQFAVLLHQVKLYKPEIIYVYSNIFITEKQIIELKKHTNKIVLQWSCPVWNESIRFPYHKFDLIITAALQLKEYFENKKINTAYIQQAFDDSIVSKFKQKTDSYKGDVLFIGSFTLGHHHRFEVLEYLLQQGVNLTIHGTGKESLPTNSLVYKYMKEPLHGLDMYNEYRNYKMAIHIHTTGHENDGINWNKYAGAKRLFEITGSGTLLLTSNQDNVKDLFEIDKEVIVFNDAEDLLLKINNIVNDDDKIKKMALAGMERTLKNHSFLSRAKELEPILFNK